MALNAFIYYKYSTVYTLQLSINENKHLALKSSEAV